MAVRKLGSSWWVDFRSEGTRYRKRSPINTRGGALEYETILRGRLARGEPLAGQQTITPRFAAFSSTWLEAHAKTNNRPSTVRAKRGILRRYLVPTFGKLLVSEIAPALIERYKAARLAEGLSPKTINNHLTVLHAALATAEEWGHIANAPRVRWLKAPPSPFTFLSPVECERLLQSQRDPMLYELLLCALRTGMRRGELTALEWSDVELEGAALIAVRRSVVRGIISSPKNNRIRHIPIATDLGRILAQRKERTGLVFPALDGTMFPEATMTKLMHRACSNAGIRRVGWHVLRHTFASQLVAYGVPIRSVQILLGHSTVQVTERYAHLSPSSLHDAIRVLVRPSTEILGQQVVNNGGLGRADLGSQEDKFRLDKPRSELPGSCGEGGIRKLPIAN